MAHLYGQDVLAKLGHLKDYNSRLNCKVLKRMPRIINPSLVPYYIPPLPKYKHSITATLKPLTLEHEYKLDHAQTKEILRIEDVSMYIITPSMRVGLIAGPKRLKILDITSVDDTFPNKKCIVWDNRWIYPLVKKISPTYMYGDTLLIVPDPYESVHVILRLSQHTPVPVRRLLSNNMVYFSRHRYLPPKEKPLVTISDNPVYNNALKPDCINRTCMDNIAFTSTWEGKIPIENVVHEDDSKDNFCDRNLIPQRKSAVHMAFYRALKQSYELLVEKINSQSEEWHREAFLNSLEAYLKAQEGDEVELIEVMYDDRLIPKLRSYAGVQHFNTFVCRTRRLFVRMTFLGHIERMRLQNEDSLCTHEW